MAKVSCHQASVIDHRRDHSYRPFPFALAVASSAVGGPVVQCWDGISAYPAAAWALHIQGTTSLKSGGLFHFIGHDPAVLHHLIAEVHVHLGIHGASLTGIAHAMLLQNIST